VTPSSYADLNDLPSLVNSLRAMSKREQTEQFVVILANAATAIDGQAKEIVVLNTALKIAVQSCPCTPRERMSGHRTECYVPELLSLLAAFKA